MASYIDGSERRTKDHFQTMNDDDLWRMRNRKKRAETAVINFSDT